MAAGRGDAPFPGRGSAYGQAFALLERARGVLVEAAAADGPDERFRLAHLAALRTAAAVLADRGRPASARRRLISAWVLIESVAPEYAEWAGYFAAGAAGRAAIEAGATHVVSSRAADDQLRSAWAFLDVVQARLGLLATPLAS
ncbi:MAG: SAV_6107 family HEPN domain-containing protein [Jatrophihabitantaceae bacterium]